jgi:hypothetical protein
MGSKAFGSSEPQPLTTKRRPARTGGVIVASPSMPTLPAVQPPKLKAPKGETRQVELRGQVRKLYELTKGVQSKFPNAMPLTAFVAEAKRVLHDLGFQVEKSLAVVGLTRDEVTRPFLNAITDVFGEPYVTHSLGAMVNIGKEGMKQILLHAPRLASNHRTKIVIFSAPNIACNQDGDTGMLYRPNLPEATVTNSELTQFIQKFQRGTFNLHKSQRNIGEDPGDDIDVDMMDPDDIELSVLGMKLSKQMLRDGGFNGGDLASVTCVAARAALHDWERLIEKYVNLDACDITVMSCVQVNGQYQDMGRVDELKYETDFIALREGIAYVNGVKRTIGKVEDKMALEVHELDE